MLATCVSTVRSVSQSRRAMPGLVRPSATSASTSRSRGVSAASWSVARSGLSSSETTSGSSAEPPLRDAEQRVEELVDVEDAVLEQIAEAPGADQLDRVLRFDVLGEQHDP